MGDATTGRATYQKRNGDGSAISCPDTGKGVVREQSASSDATSQIVEVDDLGIDVREIIGSLVIIDFVERYVDLWFEG